MLQCYHRSITISINGVIHKRFCDFEIEESDSLQRTKTITFDWEQIKEELKKESPLVFPFNIQRKRKGLVISMSSISNGYVSYKEWAEKIKVEIVTQYKPCTMTLQEIFNKIPSDIAIQYIKERL